MILPVYPIGGNLGASNLASPNRAKVDRAMDVRWRDGVVGRLSLRYVSFSSDPTASIAIIP